MNGLTNMKVKLAATCAAIALAGCGMDGVDAESIGTAQSELINHPSSAGRAV